MYLIIKTSTILAYIYMYVYKGISRLYTKPVAGYVK